MRRIVVGIAGASGTVYGKRVLARLAAIPDVEALTYHVHTIKNVAAPIASGSFRTAGMIVAPCSIRVLSAVVNSASTDLLTRAATSPSRSATPSSS